MPVLKHQLTPLETFMPSIDHRNAGRSFVVDGANYYFDSKGPRSGFTTRMLTPFPLEKAKDVQGIQLEDRTFVFTQDAILSWRQNVPYMWELLYSFASEITDQYSGPWSAIFLEGVAYFAQPARGMFGGIITPNEDAIILVPKTEFNTPGLITGIRDMAIVRGRPVLVNNDTIQWGAVGNMLDFTPALGGAGFQLMSAFVQGTFLGLSSFQDGFVVWTTGGPIVGEYIGGDGVWNFYPMTNRERPIGKWTAAKRMTNGNMVFLTQQGLFVTNGIGEISPFSQDFNEFFLSYMEKENGQLTPHQFWRLDYNELSQMLFLSESADGNSYFRSFVFTPTREKWGMFSDRVKGFLPFTNDSYGFVDNEGYCHYFTKLQAKETIPDNSLGYNRLHPLRQKSMLIPSSTMVSHAYVYDPALPMDPLVPAMDGWYDGAVSIPKIDYPIGLNSWIEIGLVRPPEMQGMVSDLVEIQEMTFSSIPVLPNFDPDYRSDHHLLEFYALAEDWNSEATVVDGDYEEDYDVLDGGYDWLTEMPPNHDYLYENFPTITFDIESSEDWNLDAVAENWGGQFSGLNPLTYGLQWLGSLDGITVDFYQPEMARFDSAAQLWTGLSSGAFHRIRVEAITPYQYYWASYIAVSLGYQGKLT